MSAPPRTALLRRWRHALGKRYRHLLAKGYVRRGRALAASGRQDAAIATFREAFDLDAATPLHVYETLHGTESASLDHERQAEALQRAGHEERASGHFALAIAHAGRYRESRDLDQILQHVVVDSGVVITQFAINFFPLFEIWYRQFRRSGGDKLLVIALDPVVYRKVRELGVAAYLLPVFNFQAGIRGVLWLETVKFRQRLIERGVDYVHSDLDAIWLENPLAEVLANQADIVASIAYGTPRYVVDSWGFVMCLGFYRMRSNAQTRMLFPDYVKYTEMYGHDQNGLNTLLLERGIRWRREGDMLYGRCESPGLDLAVLPDSMISRQATLCSGEQRPKVVHPLLGGRSMTEKLAQLAQAGIT